MNKTISYVLYGIISGIILIILGIIIGIVKKLNKSKKLKNLESIKSVESLKLPNTKTPYIIKDPKYKPIYDNQPKQENIYQPKILIIEFRFFRSGNLLVVIDNPVYNKPNITEKELFNKFTNQIKKAIYEQFVSIKNKGNLEYYHKYNNDDYDVTDEITEQNIIKILNDVLVNKNGIFYVKWSR